MWDFGIGVIIGIYLGTYYDFRPVLESLTKWGSDRLPPPRDKSLPGPPSFLTSFFAAGEKSKVI